MRALSLLVASVAGHGGLTYPPPRNNYGNTDPMNFSKLGPTDEYKDGWSCAGNECLWFSEGCYPGCPECSGKMPEKGNYFGKPNCDNPMEPTLPVKYKTWNLDNSSIYGDFTKYHPWRSPGHAPVLDPCGIAGGYHETRGGGGQTPYGAKQGDLGSKLPPLEGVHTVWQAGGIADVGFMLGANHGGGYLYSICPKTETLTEECLQAHPLSFANFNHTIKYLDGRPPLQIPATDVSEGTFPPGSVWRRDPIPACNCDGGDGCRGTNSTDSARRSYADDPKPDPYGFECPTGTMFEVPFPYGYGQHIWNNPKTGPSASSWVIMDQLHVPAEEGEYVLRWRWDVEQNPQIWTHCADIVISKSAPPPAPTPAPATPTPAPATSGYHCIDNKCVRGSSGGLLLKTCEGICGH